MKTKTINFDVEKYFLKLLDEDTNLSVGIASIKTLLYVLDQSKFDTVQELHSTIQSAVKIMRESDKPITAIVSASELFSRFITLAKFDDKTMDEVKDIMLSRGNIFLAKLQESRSIIARQLLSFVTDGCRILTHSKSRVVLSALKLAAASKKRFQVFVTHSFPDNGGEKMCKELTDAGIECTVILDSAIGYVMETVDFVLCGAEGVVESGGIINRVGTFTIAMCAREMKKPVYVLAESFKFTRLYPLNQRDLPRDYKYPRHELNADLSKIHPLVDYTPPSYITLIFTDLGILTPSAVSDELIKLYL
uniref:Translation initiation factor eIF2B subunit alpha n=1 Tax=Corethrella appendiculata TaxID=1370023 RepID=U5EXD1_9DIPT